MLVGPPASAGASGTDSVAASSEPSESSESESESSEPSESESESAELEPESSEAELLESELLSEESSANAVPAPTTVRVTAATPAASAAVKRRLFIGHLSSITDR
jgi:hypothetical protein